MNRRRALRVLRARRATAHHEAGHAVMAWALGLTVESVSIKARRNSHGRVLIDVPRWVSRGDPANPVVRLWAEANIMSQMSQLTHLSHSSRRHSGIRRSPSAGRCPWGIRPRSRPKASYEHGSAPSDRGPIRARILRSLVCQTGAD